MLLRHHPNRPDGPVFFLSDAHIGTGSADAERDKEEKLLAFFDEAERSAAALVILGDLFDFWFEYRQAIPSRGFRVLARLEQLVRSGLPVDFLGGNHDFWVGGFLRNQLGIATHLHPIDVECQGRRLFLAHGDGIAPGDLGYRVLRKVFRNRLSIALYRLLHPDLGIPLATSSSNASRRMTDTIPVIAGKLWEGIAAPQFDRGRDAVLIGHFHHPIHIREEGRDFIVNGDWFRTWSYSVLEDGILTLRLWGGGTVPTSNK